MIQQTAQNWQILLHDLRSQDFDRYACCLFAPQKQRADLVALFLFNATLAQIRDQVTEPVLGQIRLQWWSEALAAITHGGKAPVQPTLNIIASWCECGFDLSPLQTLITARAAELANPPFPALAEYNAYRQNTSRPLGVMAARILQQEQHAALYAESMELYATVGLLRAVPHWVRRRQLPMPPEWIKHHNIAEADLMELRITPELTDWLHRVTTLALQNSVDLQKRWRDLPTEDRQTGLAIRLHLSLACCDAKQLLHAANPWQQMAPTRWLRLAKLAWQALCGK